MAKRRLLTEGEVGAEGLVPDEIPGTVWAFLQVGANLGRHLYIDVRLRLLECIFLCISRLGNSVYTH